MAVRQPHLTLEEFLKLPEAEPALEFIAGKVRQKVAPQGRHGKLQPRLAEYFRHIAETRGLAVVFTELRTTFAGWSPIPDVAVYRWERIRWGRGSEVPDEFYEPPDITIEISSPAQSKAELTEKCAWYVAHGVSLALLVDPDDYSVTVFRPDASPSVLRGADAIDFAPVLPGMRLGLRRLFGWLRPRGRQSRQQA